MSPGAKENLRSKRKAAFLERAKAKHGDLYDYSRVDYTTQKEDVTIGCPVHGWIKQTPDRHLNSCGCGQCGQEAASQAKHQTHKKLWLEKFERVNGHVLELLSDYTGSHNEIELRCLAKGHIFTRQATKIDQDIKGSCPVCDREALWESMRLPQKEFVRRVQEKHPHLGTDKINYQGQTTSVTISCEFHGDVEATPVVIMQSSYGCPRCGDEQIGYAGYRLRALESGDPRFKARPTRIALMRMHVWGIECLKVGVTTRSLEARYRDDLIEVYFEAVLDEIDALKLEALIHQQFDNDRDLRVLYKGMRDGARWSGDSEIYNLDAKGRLYDALVHYVKEIEEADVDYWSRHDLLERPALRARKSAFEGGEWNEKKAVICIDDGQVFDSATAAAQKYGSTQGNISSVCTGRRRTTAGKRFAYLSDFEAGHVRELEPARIGNNAYNAKAVRCVETGKIYPSLMEAQRQTGISSSHIGSVCKGKRTRAGGCRWEYVTGRFPSR